MSPARIPVAESLAALAVADHDWDVFAVLAGKEQRTTKQGKPFWNIELTDVDSTVDGKIWSDSAAMAAIESVATGSPVKVRCEVGTYNNALQLKVQQIRAVSDDEPEYDPARLFDPILSKVEHLLCGTLVFDIETVPAHELRKLPITVAEALTKYTNRKDMEASAVMGLSPFFGKVVSIAIGDGEVPLEDQQIGALIVPPPGREDDPFPEGVLPMTEAEALRAFWTLAARADVVVTYNGRGFDVPFLIGRSLVHGVPARVDLMSKPFTLKPHLDLFDVIGQRGRGPSSLDVVCWALGIESPKGQMDGSMVAPAYEKGEIEKIATYNKQDVRATTAIYHKVRDGVLRFRGDW